MALADKDIDAAAFYHLGVPQAEDFNREDQRRREFARAIETAATEPLLAALGSLLKACDRAESLATFADTYAKESARFQLYDAMSSARKMVDPTTVQHDSDCSLHNEPAYPSGPCDCSANPAAAPLLERIAELEKWQHEHWTALGTINNYLVSKDLLLTPEDGGVVEAARNVVASIAALEAQVEQAAQPVLMVEREPDYWSGGNFHKGEKPHIDPTKVWGLPIGTKLYTMPLEAP